MQYGICNLSLVPLRIEPNDATEMVSQLLYGEHFKVLESRKKWCKIRIAFDGYEGWIDHKQFFKIAKEEYDFLEKKPQILVSDLVEFAIDTQEKLIPISLGASLSGIHFFNHKYAGQQITGKKSKKTLCETAFLYLNAPYLWGGKSPFGIDCSGFTQMVYKLSGYHLLRDARQQVTQGEALAFIEESEPGDLAFFDNEEGNIVHVGIILEGNYIIHAHGKVRIDRIDHTGIFNVETKSYSHNLRVIKKMI